MDRTIKLWDLEKEAVLHTLRGHEAVRYPFPSVASFSINENALFPNCPG